MARVFWLSSRNFFRGDKIYCYANFFCYAIVFGPNFRMGQTFSGRQTAAGWGSAPCPPCGRKPGILCYILCYQKGMYDINLSINSTKTNFMLQKLPLSLNYCEIFLEHRTKLKDNKNKIFNSERRNMRSLKPFPEHTEICNLVIQSQYYEML